PAWKQALLITDFQGNTRKGSSTSLSVALPLSTYLLLTKEFRNNLKLSVFSSLNVQREMIRSSAFNIKVSVPLRLGSIKTD
ncbi:hypothetical protein OAD04_02120, partial [Schleiferiaceae bacterium]|nr:hypothetical protein [Schleiferiaceae bacterium]